MLHSFFIACPFLLLFLGAECKQGCKDKLVKASLVPQWANYSTQGNLQIVYANGSLKEFPVQCGNEISGLVTTTQPVVTYDVKGKCDKVAIIMFDPDAPLKMNPFLHWFVRNIPAGMLKQGYSSKAGTVHASYFPPGSAIAGNHRYTTCIYCQHCSVYNKYKHKKYDLDRIAVSPWDLKKKFGLDNPLACNFFYSVVTGVGNKLKSVPLIDDVGDLNKDLGNSDKGGPLG